MTFPLKKNVLDLRVGLLDTIRITDWYLFGLFSISFSEFLYQIYRFISCTERPSADFYEMTSTLLYTE